MSPYRLIDWAVAIGICVIILAWVARILGFGGRRSRRKLEERIFSMENRLDKLEKSESVCAFDWIPRVYWCSTPDTCTSFLM